VDVRQELAVVLGERLLEEVEERLGVSALLLVVV
jgi:hypothetical protein